MMAIMIAYLVRMDYASITVFSKAHYAANI